MNVAALVNLTALQTSSVNVALIDGMCAGPLQFALICCAQHLLDASHDLCFIISLAISGPSSQRSPAFSVAPSAEPSVSVWEIFIIVFDCQKFSFQNADALKWYPFRHLCPKEFEARWNSTVARLAVGKGRG
jgi:hypothetical protein